jgi:hypothetical protein
MNNGFGNASGGKNAEYGIKIPADVCLYSMYTREMSATVMRDTHTPGYFGPFLRRFEVISR